MHGLGTLTMKQFPVLLDLKNRTVVVVGGGNIAEGKIRSILDTGALIKIVSPTLTDSLVVVVAEGKVKHLPRIFEESDLDGCWLVIAATNDDSANENVYQAAPTKPIFCN